MFLVCKLNPGVLPDTFISSSWDSTARLWKIIKESEKRYLAVLISICNGHSMAVWSAIQLSTKHLITGSADKTIHVHVIVFGKHDKSTTIIKKLTGHTDCVRDLASLKENEFLSCSNDATVKHWNQLTGECLQTFHSHPSYIYSLWVDPLNSIFVTGGEDRYVNVQQNSEQQVILHPAQSIWSVAVLPNSDIVTGSSDGVIRIFSTDFKRQASDEELTAFQQEVENVNQIAEKENDELSIEGLPGPDKLLISGKTDNELVTINENGKRVVYKWLSDKLIWEKVEDFTNDKIKVAHEGKEYDYMWNVDIQDNMPSLKLLYNKTEDPWSVAQKFIHTNSLPQSYLETIAKFIISNAKLNPNEVSAVSLNNVDPYTGNARYVPTSSNPSAFFPQTDYIKFDHGKIDVIFNKLESFNAELKEEFYKLSENELLSILSLLQSNVDPDIDTVNLLMSLVCDWPHEILFPVLDIIRLAVRNKNINDILSSDDIIIKKLLPHIQNIENPINQMLSIRCLCNLMFHEKGELLILKHYELILIFIQKLEKENLSQKHLQVAIATFLLNLSVMIKQSEDAMAIQNITNTISALCLKLSEPNAIKRCFVAIGTLLSLKNPPTLSTEIQDYIELIIALPSSETSDIITCCKDIKNILRNSC
ncbi:Hypothetical protein CINCED_3A021224 [Cinara cedri]|uniref:Phospholipase A-2-activating protein n=1 Tax=Cinara cedri TaxID=506608 RepID=A0A5E4N0G3_9HEMI|nr:Hypothetical protein CINCED_3A021224 [Cinara cedri]